MTVPADVIGHDQGLRDWCILHGYRGSIAHGMYEPSSGSGSIDDKDTMAVCVPSIEHYYGLAEYGSRGTREIKHGEWSLERVKTEAARLFRRAEVAYDHCSLPVRPDRERVGRLAVEVVEAAFAERGV